MFTIEKIRILCVFKSCQYFLYQTSYQNYLKSQIETTVSLNKVKSYSWNILLKLIIYRLLFNIQHCIWANCMVLVALSESKCFYECAWSCIKVVHLFIRHHDWLHYLKQLIFSNSFSDNFMILILLFLFTWHFLMDVLFSTCST